MIKCYIPESKGKHKTNIRGLWLSESQGLCYDYLRQSKIDKAELDKVKADYKQEAIFYQDKGKAYVYYNKAKQDTFKWVKYYSYKRKTKGLKGYLKDLLKLYGGLTVYVRTFDYLIEAWQ